MSKLSNVASASDASFGSLPTSREPAREPTPVASDQADVRLIIEEDAQSGAFIYKTMDRRTGQVIQQFPRDEILRLQHGDDYTAGAVIDARA